MSSDVISVIGMHRSGTSMVAHLLQQAGLYLGPEDQLLGPDAANPEGHFEHVGFLNINEAILQRFGSSWDVPPDLDASWASLASLNDIRQAAETLIAGLSHKPVWGWKDPRTTILVPFWRSVIGHIRFVICVRNPLDVAMSLASRNQMQIDHGLLLWERYMRAAIRDTEGCPRCLVFYEDFFREENLEMCRLLKFCGLEWSGPNSLLSLGVRAGLRHHSSGITDLLNNTSILWYSKLLYLGLRACRADDSNSKAGSDALSRNASRVLKLLDELHAGSREESVENALFEKSRELAGLRQESTQLKNQLNELQQHAERLEKFSDAVRRTWAYRVYRNFIKPIQSI